MYHDKRKINMVCDRGSESRFSNSARRLKLVRNQNASNFYSSKALKESDAGNYATNSKGPFSLDHVRYVACPDVSALKTYSFAEIGNSHQRNYSNRNNLCSNGGINGQRKIAYAKEYNSHFNSKARHTAHQQESHPNENLLSILNDRRLKCEEDQTWSSDLLSNSYKVTSESLNKRPFESNDYIRKRLRTEVPRINRCSQLSKCSDFVEIPNLVSLNCADSVNAVAFNAGKHLMSPAQVMLPHNACAIGNNALYENNAEDFKFKSFFRSKNSEWNSLNCTNSICNTNSSVRVPVDITSDRFISPTRLKSPISMPVSRFSPLVDRSGLNGPTSADEMTKQENISTETCANLLYQLQIFTEIYNLNCKDEVEQNDYRFCNVGKVVSTVCSDNNDPKKFNFFHLANEKNTSENYASRVNGDNNQENRSITNGSSEKSSDLNVEDFTIFDKDGVQWHTARNTKRKHLKVMDPSASESCEKDESMSTLENTADTYAFESLMISTNLIAKLANDLDHLCKMEISSVERLNAAICTKNLSDEQLKIISNSRKVVVEYHSAVERLCKNVNSVLMQIIPKFDSLKTFLYKSS